jgi:biotin/methionine sulfoxide reductase
MLLNPGQPYRFNGREHRYPNIRYIHWAGGNPFHHHQQLARLWQAWEKPETIIVNEIFWTPAARLADIVLPVTTSLERNDIGGSSRDRYALAMHKAIEPLHQARHDLDIFGELADRLGYGQAYMDGKDEMTCIRDIYVRFAEKQESVGVAMPAFEEFWSRGHVRLPAPERDFVLFEGFRNDPQGHPLSTPSGKIELYSETIASFALNDCGPHPRWMPPEEWLGTADMKYPLHLVTVQPATRLHSQLDFAPLSRSDKVAGVEALLLHPDDAAERGISDGDPILVFNERGAILAGARLSDGLRRGVVVGATGAWFDPDPNSPALDRAGAMNMLTLDIGTSELTQGPNAMTCLVDVRRDDRASGGN